MQIIFGVIGHCRFDQRNYTCCENKVATVPSERYLSAMSSASAPP
jgi:hypothetical protein